MGKKKVNLKDEAEAANGKAELITLDTLNELCPAAVRAKFKSAKTLGQKADLLFTIDRKELAQLRKAYNQMDDFVTKLEQWFIQALPEDQSGVSGKLGRIERKTKDIPIVEDWAKFYAHVKKNGQFDLFQRRLNDKAVRERWEQKKQIPGVGTMKKSVISITAVKGD